jgi:hypothetical protein
MLLEKIAIVLLSSFLNWAGGYHWLWARRWSMTFLIALGCAFFTHCWWIFPLVMIPMAISLSLHDQNRGVWCVMTSLGASIALLLTGHLAWYWFIVYNVINYVLGWQLVKNKQTQLICDTITGAGFGLIVFLI